MNEAAGKRYGWLAFVILHDADYDKVLRERVTLSSVATIHRQTAVVTLLHDSAVDDKPSQTGFCLCDFLISEVFLRFRSSCWDTCMVDTDRIIRTPYRNHLQPSVAVVSLLSNEAP